jgi:hypothetical protein
MLCIIVSLTCRATMLFCDLLMARDTDLQEIPACARLTEGAQENLGRDHCKIHSRPAVMPAKAGIPYIGFADDFDEIPACAMMASI